MREYTKKLIELAMENDPSISSTCRQAVLSAISGTIELPPPAFITQAEMARELSVTRQTIRNLVKSGKLHPIAVTPGGLLRYRRDEIISLGASRQ